MNCIKCDGEMQKINIGEVEIDQCGKCSGIWFDLGELEKVLKLEDINVLKNKLKNNQSHDEEKVRCPRCGGSGNMVPVLSLNNKNIHIDTCLVCYGQWLDGGELEGLKEEGILQKILNIFS